MKSLMSVNKKFMSVNPKKLVEMILESKYTKGVEVYVDINNDKELKYLDDLVFELKKNDLVLQIHGNVELELSKQLEYMKKLEKHSDYLGYPIIVTLHTIYDEDEKISLDKSTEYLSELVNSIDNDKVVISVENLNDDFVQKYRLEKEKIRELILNNEKIYFTYDIGHELADYGDLTNIDEYMLEDIRNVHIHTHDGKGYDHQPIYKHDNNWNDLMKALTFLIVNNYQYNVTYEYDLNCCIGDTVEDRIKDYLNSIDFVSEKYIEIRQ